MADKTKTQDVNEVSDRETAIYVYCVGNKNEVNLELPDAVPTIEDGEKLTFIVETDLVAVTSKVPLSSYDENSLREKLLDPSWTAIRAMRHQRVVEHYSREAGVVPLRFGTIYLNESGVEAMLQERADALTKLLEKLHDKEEWGINVYFDQEHLFNSITKISERLKALAEQARQSSPGQSYLLQKKLNSLRRDEARSEISRTVERLENGFKAHSESLRKLRVFKGENSEQGELTAKFAALIRRSNFEEFREFSEHLARENEKTGLRLEFAGPLPPYNFTDVE